MPGYRVAAAVALATAAAVVAVAGAVVTRGDGGTGEEAARVEPIAATAELAPRVVLFGDTLTAHVDVVVDHGAVDPDAVRVAWSPAPWALAEPPTREASDAGPTTHIRTTFLLRCLSALCVPARETERVDLRPALVTYSAPAGAAAPGSPVEVAWPTVAVHTRLGDLDSAQQDVLSAPWRADLVSLPAVSYSASPGLVLVLLLGAGSMLVVAAAVLAYRALPEREPPPEPEPPPPPVVPPLEQALALLESPAAVNGAQDRRRALELCADEVERFGDEELAQTARALAWSADVPQPDLTRAFAARLRRKLEIDGTPS